MTEALKKKSILLVEDHEVFREGLRMLLANDVNLEVAAEAGTGHEALTICKSQPFDIIVLDIRLPDMSGIEVAHRLTAECPGATIMMLSMRDEEEVRESLPPTVSFVSKAESPQLMIDTIRQKAAEIG